MINLSSGLLAGSTLAALFIRNSIVLFLCIVLTNYLAFEEKFVTLEALAYFCALTVIGLLYFHVQKQNAFIKVVGFFILATLCAGFVLHEIPGFSKIIIFDHVKISSAARTYTKYLNFDKVMAALILYTASGLCAAEKELDVDAIKQTILVYLVCVACILTPAIMSNYIKFDPKLPTILPFWIVNNLLFVCFSEEVIFRGFLQTQLKSCFKNNGLAVFLSIVLASIIFGLAHYKDGHVFMGLAAICGLFYGYVYHKTERITCVVLVHFALNLTHILLFTYP